MPASLASADGDEQDAASSQGTRPTVKKPKQRSCDACRLRKVACSYRSVRLNEVDTASALSPRSSSSNVSEARKPCLGCRNKKLECIISNEDIPFTRNRTGKNIQKARASGGGSRLDSTGGSIVTQSELSLISTATSGRLGHHLIEACVDSTHRLMDRPPFCPPLCDQWTLQERFEAAGCRMERLSTSEQLMCSIMLAFGARKVATLELGGPTRNDAFVVLSQRAEAAADRYGLWRKTDPNSINLMILMLQLMCDGDITSKLGRQYRRAAIASLEEITPDPTITGGDDAGFYCYLALLLSDSSSALESGQAPLLSQNTVNKFSRSRGLPDPKRLLELSLEHTLECLIILNRQALEYAGLVLRTAALYISTLPHMAEPSGNMDHRMLWSQLDVLEKWLVQVRGLLSSELYISLYLNMIWCTRIIAEWKLCQVLAAKAASLCTGDSTIDITTFSIALQESNTSKRRLQQALLSFLISTASNTHKINSLALLTGCLWSKSTLRKISSSFREACQSCPVHPASNAETEICSDRLSLAEHNIAEAYSEGKLLSDQSQLNNSGANSQLEYGLAYHSAGSAATCSTPATTGSQAKLVLSEASSATTVAALDTSATGDAPAAGEPVVGGLDDRDLDLMDSWIDWLHVNS